MSDGAHVLPIIAPDAAEGLAEFLTRAARVLEWPEDSLEEDLAILAELCSADGNAEAALRRASHVVRALSFVSAPTMALRHLDRYVRAVSANPAEELDELVPNAEHLHFLCSLFGFSAFLSEIAIARPDHLAWTFTRGRLNSEKTRHQYLDGASGAVFGTAGFEARRAHLMDFKKRELLRIGIRDLWEKADTGELCRELSGLAEAIVRIAYRDCLMRLIEKHGDPLGEDSKTESGYCVYAMGKFGAEELNFSSDIDLVFVYDQEGETTGVPEGIDGRPIRRISNHEFFNRLSRELGQYLNDADAAGFFYRVDARLRPEGASGPLARSLSAYGAYLQTQAGLWEKIAYLKARCVAGDERLARQMDRIFESFVYLGNREDELLPEVSRLKRRIDHERLDAESQELDIKRGRGGIREIEFIAAALQLLHAEKQPALRVRSTLRALDLLVERGLMAAAEADRLRTAYHLFRRIEHTLQMMHESQTHRMPSAPRDRAALALRCGFAEPAAFEAALEGHRSFVRAAFEKMFRAGAAEAPPSLAECLLGEGDPTPEMLRELEPAGLGTLEHFRLLQGLAVGTNDFLASARSQRSFAQLLPRLLAELPHAAQPEQAVRQFDLLLRANLGADWIWEFCCTHPPILRLLLRVLGYGSFLGRQLVAHPEWLDEMLQGDGLLAGRTRRAIGEFAIPPALAADAAFVRLRQFKNLEGFLISVQEVLGIAKPLDGGTRMAELAAETCRHAAEIVRREVGRAAPFAVLGLGGLGDGQVHFGGDIDIAFVGDDGTEIDGHSPLHWAERMGRAYVARLAELTPDGVLWKVDARLRPDGRSGPVAATRRRYLDYYAEEAGIWEWQALTKARCVAGDFALGEAVLADLGALWERKGPPADLAPEILAMRRRIDETVRLPSNVAADLKRSPGGIVDVEFLLQFRQLSRRDAITALRPLTSSQLLDWFDAEGILPRVKARFLREHYDTLRIVQRAHRILNETTSDYLPEDRPRAAVLARALASQLDDAADTLAELPERMAKARGMLMEELGG